MSSSSWTSSNTTTSCGGSSSPPTASAATYRWVLTTTTSAWAARSRAASAKQTAPDGQRAAPGQSRAPTLTWAQAAGLGSQASSARSPVAALPAQSTSRRISRPSGPSGGGPDRGRPRVGVEPELLVTAGHLRHPLPADVVGPALEHRELEGHAEGSHEVGEVPGGQLILEGLGGGGHHRPGAENQRRDQVGQALAGAGARLNDQVALAPDGVRHRLGHRRLGRSVFVLGQPGRGARQGGMDGGVGHDVQATVSHRRESGSTPGFPPSYAAPPAARQPLAGGRPDPRAGGLTTPRRCPGAGSPAPRPAPGRAPAGGSLHLWTLTASIRIACRATWHA